MACVISILLLFSHLILTPYTCSCHPLVFDSRAPCVPKTPLIFFPCNGSVCCDSIEDSILQKQLQGVNISDPACTSIHKPIICINCNEFSAELLEIESRTTRALILCNSTVHVNNRSDFCAKVRDACHNVSILHSPFSSSLQGRAGVAINSSSDFWQSKNVSCDALAGPSDNGELCFNGKPVSVRITDTPPPLNGLCLEKITNGSYIHMAAHPDGSDRIFLAGQQGKIWLATVPEEGSGEVLVLDESNTFLDLTDVVHFDAEHGLMSMAFHPQFALNGRFFVSFNCNKIKWPECSGRCSCNADVNCDPSKLGSQNGDMPCQYHSVIAEFTANGTAPQPSLASRANPSEVRRIFTIGLPYSHGHAGQILFGPSDGYLYYIVGDGGGGDPYNFAQNKKSLHGKILRLDIDNIPSAEEIGDRGMWGNYSIPSDNPCANDEELLPEIWALGFRDPWRCSFDSKRPSYFLCGDPGQNQFEEVDLVIKGGNYGWRVYEGATLFNPLHSPGGNTSATSITPIFPLMGYNHSTVNPNEGSASIIGGYFYRSNTDPCLYGRYLYADLYGSAMWAGTESPENSRNFNSTRLSFRCSHNSPIQCSSVGESPLPSLGYIYSMGEDNRREMFILTSSGVYRVARPIRCNYTCSKENVRIANAPTFGSSLPSSGSHLEGLQNKLLLFFSSSFLLRLCLIL